MDYRCNEEDGAIACSLKLSTNACQIHDTSKIELYRPSTFVGGQRLEARGWEYLCRYRQGADHAMPPLRHWNSAHTFSKCVLRRTQSLGSWDGGRGLPAPNIGSGNAGQRVLIENRHLLLLRTCCSGSIRRRERRNEQGPSKEGG